MRRGRGENCVWAWKLSRQKGAVLFVCLFISQSVCMSTDHSICLSVCLSIFESIGYRVIFVMYEKGVGQKLCVGVEAV
jgi:hypothetical protein